MATPQPLLLLIDDLQWCDQETLEWLRYLLHFDPQARVLVLGTVRIEEIDDAHPLTPLLRHLRSADQLTEIELEPLNAEQTAILADQIAQESLTPALQQTLYRATAGNPLFVVETVRAGLSNQRLEIGDQATIPDLQSPISNIQTLPPKVQAVIQYRLAQLSPVARDLAHLAAVLGQAFTFDLLVQASGKHEDEVMSALNELWQRRIIIEQGTHSYDFSHDRIREVAYAESNLVWRRQLHRQLALALEQRQAVELDPISGEIAFHYEQAGLFEQARIYYQQAAQAAQIRYAYSEAIHHLQHALAVLKSLPATRQAKAQELDMQIKLGGLLRATQGLATPEVGETYNIALDLCRLVGNPAQRYIVQSKLLWYHTNRGEFRTARQFAEMNLALTQGLPDQETLHDAYMGVGSVQLFVGEFAAARHQFECALALPIAHRLRLDQVEADSPTFVSLALSALDLWLLGYPDQARQHVQQTVDLLQRYANPLDSVITLEFVLMVQACLRDVEAMRTQAEEIAALATKYEFAMYQSLGTLYTGFVRARQGAPTPGIAQLQHGLDWVKQSAVVLLIPYQLTLLAQACALAGQNAEALKFLDEALAIVEQTGETWWQAELFRLRGDLLLTLPRAGDDAQAWYGRAIQVARQQNAKSLELRAATSLARLWQQQGRLAEAYEMLADIYNWFSEGFDTVDLQEAKALLEALST